MAPHSVHVGSPFLSSHLGRDISRGVGRGPPPCCGYHGGLQNRASLRVGPWSQNLPSRCAPIQLLTLELQEMQQRLKRFCAEIWDQDLDRLLEAESSLREKFGREFIAERRAAYLSLLKGPNDAS